MFLHSETKLVCVLIALSVLAQGCGGEPEITKDSTLEEVLEYKRYAAKKKLELGMDRMEMFQLLGMADAIEVETEYDVYMRKNNHLRIYWYFYIARVKTVNDKIVEITPLESKN